MEVKCGICGAPADCHGWMYPSNVPGALANGLIPLGVDPNSDQWSYCEEHCEHDCCASVKERIEDGTIKEG